MSPRPEITDFNQVALPARIIKRDLREVDFDADRLHRTLTTIRRQYKEFSREKQSQLQAQIMRQLIHKQGAAPWPSVLQLQDAIEHSLWVNGFFKSAKHYINDRTQRRLHRQQRHRLQLLIQAMRQALAENQQNPTTSTVSQTNDNWQTLCLSLFEQILNQVLDPNSESLELSEGLKRSLMQMPAEVLDGLLAKIEEKIRP